MCPLSQAAMITLQPLSIIRTLALIIIVTTMLQKAASKSTISACINRLEQNTRLSGRSQHGRHDKPGSSGHHRRVSVMLKRSGTIGWKGGHRRCVPRHQALLDRLIRFIGYLGVNEVAHDVGVEVAWGGTPGGAVLPGSPCWRFLVDPGAVVELGKGREAAQVCHAWRARRGSGGSNGIGRGVCEVCRSQRCPGYI